MDGLTMGGHEISRRDFVRGAAGTLAVGLTLTAGLQQLGGGQAAAAEPVLTRATLDRYVGERFRLRSVTEPRALELFKVRELRFGQPATPQPEGEDSFSLLFMGPASQPLGQGVYTLDHRRLGQLTVLLVPMRPEVDARYYEAIFNRAVPR